MEVPLLQEIDVYHICHLRCKTLHVKVLKAEVLILVNTAAHMPQSQLGDLLFVQNQNIRHDV